MRRSSGKPATATAVAGHTDPEGYRAFKNTRVRCAPSRDETEAFRTVTLQAMAEAFDLYDEEDLWLGYHLDQLFAPLRDFTPHALPLPVRQELLDGTYSRLLELRYRARIMRGQAPYDATVLHASKEEWADALLDPVFASYSLRPLIESGMRGGMIGLLTELGVDGDPPRGTLFLPNDLRVRLDRR